MLSKRKDKQVFTKPHSLLSTFSISTYLNFFLRDPIFPSRLSLSPEVHYSVLAREPSGCEAPELQECDFKETQA